MPPLIKSVITPKIKCRRVRLAVWGINIKKFSLFQFGVDRGSKAHYPTDFIFDRLFHRFLSKSTYLSETSVDGVLLAADSDNFGLDIESQLKNRQTGNF